jgi:hypothetical protein
MSRWDLSKVPAYTLRRRATDLSIRDFAPFAYSKDVAEIAQRVRNSKAERASSLYRAYAGGASLRQLAELTGISHEQVRRTVLDHQSLEFPPARNRGSPDDPVA